MTIQGHLDDLADLKRLTEAADKDGQHIYMHPRDSKNWAANIAFVAAASPVLLLKLFADYERACEDSHRNRVYFADQVERCDKLKAENQSLRSAVKFAEEMFRTITSSDGSGHADLAQVLLRLAGTAVSHEPARVTCEVVPPDCRQRLAVLGKPYPRSSCASCGQFSPKWRECDALIGAQKIGGAE